MTDQRLVIVSNRGPAEFERDDRRRAHGAPRRRRPGHRALRAGRAPRGALDRLGDDRRGRRRRPRGRGRPARVELDDVTYDVLMVESDAEAYDRFYNVIANPILWFVQHYLWDLSNAPDIRREEADAWDSGYTVVNARHRRGGARDDRGRAEAAGDVPRLPPLHGAGDRPRAAARRLPPALRPHPVVAARQLADPPGALARGDLPRPARQRHHRLPHHRLLPQLPALLHAS